MGGGVIWLPCSFFKNVSAKEIVNSCFFVTFNIIISHIFPEIPQVVQNISYLTILAIFIDFYQFIGFFYISLLQRN